MATRTWPQLFVPGNFEKVPAATAIPKKEF
jgi:hypothetical protein